MDKPTYKELYQSSPFNIGNASYLEEIYESYLKNPSKISKEWRSFFENEFKNPDFTKEAIHSEIKQQFLNHARCDKTLSLSLQAGNANAFQAGNANPLQTGNANPLQTGTAKSPLTKEQSFVALQHERKQTRVGLLIDAYRLLGHLHADTDPLKLRQKPIVPELMLSYYHLTEKDLETLFEAYTLPGDKTRSLQTIIKDLQTIYCGSIGTEFMHIPDSPERAWLQTRVEAFCEQKPLSNTIKHQILKRLNAAEGLEKYLGAKYPGAKRFSIEGIDTLIVLLDALIQKGGQKVTKEFVIGMAHRGRINVLVNILGKSPNQIFDEFENKHDIKLESGDVKYHQGFSSDVSIGENSVHLSLAFNPSHLEIVSPVVCGSVRARLERRNDNTKEAVLAIIIHGDASIAGQGVVMEGLNMSQTHAYAIGGSIHIIVNNQIGFTTSDPKDARSTLYCSDIGKMLEVPIFHVNADDPEAVFRVAELAFEYREKFKKDVIIDLVGYRRHGHNEADEPSVTQPLMYQIIRKLPTVFKIYSEKLIQEGLIKKEDIEKVNNEYRNILEKRQEIVTLNLAENHTSTQYSAHWQNYMVKDWRDSPPTKVDISVLKTLSMRLHELPEGFVLHPRIQKIMDDRKKMGQGEMPVDWGFGEILTYATLLNDGYGVRFSGQDCSRGTFFHRQAVLHDQVTGKEYTPLSNISEKQVPFTIYDSLLSEEAVVAFEYGYASTEPSKLVIWEAQFGDFANGAQVVVDQFISSGEQKWGRLCGLTLFLPHGYEGQGPEHSSARLERYLQLCAEQNIQVCIPSQPAQVFHMLRRQMLRPQRKPLIVLTPKSLLRNKYAVSTLEEIANSSFMPIIPESESINVDQVRRVILCSGKVYYDLLEKRSNDKIHDIAMIRIEQLYPFPEKELKEALKVYEKVNDIVWCQEEPKNQGAWYCSQHHMIDALSHNQKLRYVGRKPAAAPAVGYHHLHEVQQKTLLEEALGPKG